MNEGNERRLQSLVDNVATEFEFYSDTASEYRGSFIEALKANHSVKKFTAWVGIEGLRQIVGVIPDNKTINEFVLKFLYNEGPIKNLNEVFWPLFNALENNESISILDITIANCYMDGITPLNKLITTIGASSNLTELKFYVTESTSRSKDIMDMLSPAIVDSGNKNIIYVSHARGELAELCKKNEKKALELFDQISARSLGPACLHDPLTEFRQRMPAIIAVARKVRGQTDEQIEELTALIKELTTGESAGKILPNKEPVIKVEKLKRQLSITPDEIRRRFKEKSGVSVGRA